MLFGFGFCAGQFFQPPATAEQFNIKHQFITGSNTQLFIDVTVVLFHRVDADKSKVGNVHGIISSNTALDMIGCHFHDIVGTEELGHLEMVGAIVHQLTRNLKDSQIQESAFAPYFVDHTVGVYPQAASGTPFTAAFLQVKGDPITDLVEDMGAEEPIKYW